MLPVAILFERRWFNKNMKSDFKRDVKFLGKAGKKNPEAFRKAIKIIRSNRRIADFSERAGK